MSPTDAKYISTAIHSIDFPQSISSQEKPGFPPSALIILDWSKVNLLFKTESGKIRIMINTVYLAIPQRTESGDRSLRFRKYLNEVC